VAALAASVAMAESGGNPNATGYDSNGTEDLGLWQINTSNGNLATYSVNGNAASAILISDNGSDWTAWTTYVDGDATACLGTDPGPLPGLSTGPPPTSQGMPSVRPRRSPRREQPLHDPSVGAGKYRALQALWRAVPQSSSKSVDRTARNAGARRARTSSGHQFRAVSLSVTGAMSSIVIGDTWLYRRKKRVDEQRCIRQWRKLPWKAGRNQHRRWSVLPWREKGTRR
jgi:hypothetical protein